MNDLNKMNLIKLMDDFGSEERCREALEQLRFPNGVGCIRCGSKHIRDIKSRNQYNCGSCGYQFSVTASTMLHDSHLPLKKWFLAVYLMTESKKGISALQLKRTLRVAYQTAWYLCHRIRAAMEDAYPMPIKGLIEIDETFVGGKVKGKGRGYKGNKAIVVGAVQRGDRIVLKVVQARDRTTLHQFINEVTSKDATAYFTDDWAPYEGIAKAGQIHETVNHSLGEYVRGDVHVNSVENVWSLLKRSIIGAYHHVSVKHLDAYLDELEWRFNNRDNPWLFRDTLLKLLDAEHVEYKELVAK
ncbi:MAG: IS1595 family transposase [Truepera sp.]|nr:IS1595 family transposase [Truepera sp.]